MARTRIVSPRRARAWPGIVLAAGLAAGCGGTERGAAPLVSSPGPAPAAAAAADTPAVESPAPATPPEAPAPVLPDFSMPSWNRVDSRAGTYRVHWRAPAGKIPRNQDCELEVWVLRDGAPVRDALLE